MRLALEVAEDREVQVASMQADAIAQLGQTVAAGFGVKNAKAEWYNPWRRAKYVQEAKQKIKPAAARCFLEQQRSQKLPSWVIQAVDMELIGAAALPS